MSAFDAGSVSYTHLETMSATAREARMIEQPGRPLHPALFPLLPYPVSYTHLSMTRGSLNGGAAQPLADGGARAFRRAALRHRPPHGIL